MNKKRAFTMVELIFVIVILGILAAVAVPRLNASRDDAEITKFIANIATIKKDAQTYYLAQGTAFTDEAKISTYYADIAKITSVPLTSSGRNLDTNRNLQIGGEKCLDVYILLSDSSEWLAFITTDGETTPSELCKKAMSREEVGALLTGSKTAYHNRPIVSIAGKDYKPGTFAYIYQPLSANGVDFD